MIPSPSRNYALGVVVALTLVLTVIGPGRSTLAQQPPVRGELARLARQAYDYNYRNSNNNVFRRSRHYHPTKNVFRSSRYYQQRLAASYDGYPLQTTVRFTRETPRGPREEAYSYVHPRRHPYGPGPDWYVGGYPGPVDLIWADEPVHEAPPGAQAEGPLRAAARTQGEIETVPLRVVRRPVRERPVMRTVTNADGTTTTLITSEPIEAAGDDAADVTAASEATGEGSQAPSGEGSQTPSGE